jgi:hypothetical protein
LISFTDSQLAMLKEAAAPIPARLRPVFLQEIAALLVGKGEDMGDGDLHRAALVARGVVMRAARVAWVDSQEGMAGSRYAKAQSSTSKSTRPLPDRH